VRGAGRKMDDPFTNNEKKLEKKSSHIDYAVFQRDLLGCIILYVI
jgi:hypothetical protein